MAPNSVAQSVALDFNLIELNCDADNYSVRIGITAKRYDFMRAAPSTTCPLLNPVYSGDCVAWFHEIFVFRPTGIAVVPKTPLTVNISV